MRIFLIYSGHSSSTYDIAWYLERALRRRDDVEVRPFPLHTEIVFNDLAIREFYRLYRQGAEPKQADVLYLAARAALGEIMAFRPDIVLVISGTAIPIQVWEIMADLRRQLRRRWMLGIVFTESPYRINEELDMAVNFADVVFTNEKSFVPIIAALHIPALYLPHAYDPVIHRPPLDHEDRILNWDAYMVGSGYRERLRILEGVDWRGIRFALRGIWPDAAQTALASFYVEGVVPNAVVAEEYRHSAVVINVHRAQGERIVLLSRNGRGVIDEREPVWVTGAYSTNARVIEAAACGAVVATDPREEVREVLGENCLYFSNSAELEEGIRGLLGDVDRRHRMGQAACACVAGRTYDHNVTTILETFRRL